MNEFLPLPLVPNASAPGTLSQLTNDTSCGPPVNTLCGGEGRRGGGEEGREGGSGEEGRERGREGGSEREWEGGRKGGRRGGREREGERTCIEKKVLQSVPYWGRAIVDRSTDQTGLYTNTKTSYR